MSGGPRWVEVALVLAAAAGAPLTVTAQSTPSEPTCEERLRANRDTFLAMGVKEFDLGGEGWRQLSRRGCKKEAAEALTTYISNHELPTHIYFHAGQLLAATGEYDKAIEMLDRSKRVEGPDEAFKWNAYVLAVRAFLTRDRAELLKQRAVIAGKADVKGNAMNLVVVDQLVKNFDLSYSAAVAELDKDNQRP